eukprot:IDg15230t1
MWIVHSVTGTWLVVRCLFSCASRWYIGRVWRVTLGTVHVVIYTYRELSHEDEVGLQRKCNNLALYSDGGSIGNAQL